MTLTDKIIVDTNTLISGILIKNSTSFKALEKAFNIGSLTFSDETFLEFELVLLRKKFDRYFSKEERLQIIQRIHNDGLFFSVRSNMQWCRDPKDDKFLNLAIESKCNCIITGDKDLLILHPFQSISIISSSTFLHQQ